jgi:16S rRNA processing protein RimM
MSKTLESKKPGNSAGSSVTGEPAFLVVGKFRHPHGLRGEILMNVATDFPDRLQPGIIIYVGETKLPLEIRSRRWHGDSLLLTFESFQNPEESGELRNQWVYVKTEDRPALPEGEYYHHQLLGLAVVSDEGHELGKMTGILDTGANDVYVVVSPSGREILLPAIEPVILDIDLERGKMLVHILPGLLEN